MKTSPLCKPAALAAFALLVIPTSLVATENEIKNGEFNQGMVKWEGECMIEGSRTPKKRDAFNVIAAGTTGPDLKVMEMTLFPGLHCTLLQKFRLPRTVDRFTVTLRYKASSDYKPATDFPVWVRVGWCKADNIAATYLRPVAGGDWQVFTNTFTVVNREYDPNFMISVRSGVGKLLVDDIQVTRLSTP